MSGNACIIIIRGNRAQANTRMAISEHPMATVTTLSAQHLIGGFESLCQLGTAVYDGTEVMTDPQKAQAVEIMGAYNVAIEPLLVAQSEQSPWKSIADIIRATLGQVNSLLDAVVENP